MSQHDQIIGNDSGANVRADINSALAALFSQSSGTSAPGTTVAGQVWLDTTNNLKKRRNLSNSAWIVEGSLDETFVLARTSNTNLGVSDRGKTIIATGTWSQVFAAVATLGDGWFVHYRNAGTGVITLDPNGSEQIDGATTLELYPGDGCMIWCDGSSLRTIGRVVTSMKTITTVRANDAATGSVAYTGVGFKPRRIEFAAAINGTRQATLFGVWESGVNACVYDSQATPGTYGTGTANCLILDEETGVKAQSATVASADVDGFTLAWTRTGTTSAGNIDIIARCYR